MKTILIYLMMITTISLNAQTANKKATSEGERNMYQFVEQVNLLMNSKMPAKMKQANLMIQVSNYIRANQMLTMEEANDGLTDAASKGCDKKQIASYINQFKKDEKVIFSSSYVSTLGDVNSNCSLAEAVRVFTMYGHLTVAADDMCKYIDCRDRSINPDLPKSRGAKEVLQYTGTKRMFVDGDSYKWKYLCYRKDHDEVPYLDESQIKDLVAEYESSDRYKNSEKSMKSAEEEKRDPTSFLLWVPKDEVTIW